MTFNPPLITLSDALQLVDTVPPYNLNLTQFHFNTDHHRKLAQEFLPVNLKTMANMLVDGDNNDGLPPYVRKFRVPVTFLFELRSLVYGTPYPPFGRSRPNRAVIREKVLRNWFGSARQRSRRYGEIAEAEALHLYRKLMISQEGRKVKIVKVETAVSPQLSFMACTPDAVMIDGHGNRRLVEIKSPFVGRNASITQMLAHDKVKDVKGNRLVRDSETWFQVQACLHVFNITNCDLVLYSSYDQHDSQPEIYVIKVKKSHTFLKIHLPTMVKTYFNHVYPIMASEILKREGYIPQNSVYY